MGMDASGRFVSSIEPDDVVYTEVLSYGVVGFDVKVGAKPRVYTDWSYADAHKIADWIKENVPESLAPPTLELMRAVQPTTLEQIRSLPNGTPFHVDGDSWTYVLLDWDRIVHISPDGKVDVRDADSDSWGYRTHKVTPL